MGGSYRKGGGLEELGVESTLMANQMRRGSIVGEESWQEAEWGSGGVCQSKSAGGAAILQQKARGRYEHSASSRRWHHHAGESQLKPGSPGEPDRLEVGTRHGEITIDWHVSLGTPNACWVLGVLLAHLSSRLAGSPGVMWETSGRQAAISRPVKR